nr:type II toxin-antitoxin system RelE/ParE family toxin [Paraliobacillus zengyii]
MMHYDLITSSATKKFIKKMKDKPLKEKFKSAFKEIQLDPFYVGEPKKGDLAGVYGYDIKHNGTSYEVAYAIEEDENGNVVLVILAGTREQFYEELKRYIKGSKIHKN